MFHKKSINQGQRNIFYAYLLIEFEQGPRLVMGVIKPISARVNRDYECSTCGYVEYFEYLPDEGLGLCPGCGDTPLARFPVTRAKLLERRGHLIKPSEIVQDDQIYLRCWGLSLFSLFHASGVPHLRFGAISAGVLDCREQSGDCSGLRGVLARASDARGKRPFGRGG